MSAVRAAAILADNDEPRPVDGGGVPRADSHSRYEWSVKVEERRQVAGFSLNEIALRLYDYAKAHPSLRIPHTRSAVHSWERGGSLPQRYVNHALADALTQEPPFAGETSRERAKHVDALRDELERLWDIADAERRARLGRRGIGPTTMVVAEAVVIFALAFGGLCTTALCPFDALGVPCPVQALYGATVDGPLDATGGEKIGL